MPEGIIKPEQSNRIKLTRDRPIKSIFKAITWRIIASATTFSLALLFFRDDPHATEKATGVAITEAFLKIIFYFLHERAWEQFPWGRMMVLIKKNRCQSIKYLKKLNHKFK